MKTVEIHVCFAAMAGLVITDIAARAVTMRHPAFA